MMDVLVGPLLIVLGLAYALLPLLTWLLCRQILATVQRIERAVARSRP